MKIICFLSILGISVLTGCATQPPSQDEIIVTSSERLYDKSLAKAEGVRSVPVKITRDSGLKGFLETAFIKIDGEYVVWLNAREQMTIYLSEFPRGLFYSYLSFIFSCLNLTLLFLLPPNF